MNKMKLDMDELCVESFATDTPGAGEGTVQGYQSGEYTCFVTCGETCDTCQPGCGPTAAFTCRNYGCTENLFHCFE